MTGKTLLNTVKYSYDADGQMTAKIITPKDGDVQTVYYETNDDNTVVKFSAGGRTVTSHSGADAFGRKVFDELQLGTGFVSRQFDYHAGAITQEHKDHAKLKSSATTQLVSRIALSDGRTISYEYDNEERIIKVDDSHDGIVEYTYDALGQLETETKGSVTTKFEYDNYGNITAKGVVDATGEIAPATKISYVYGNNTWKDLLTSYNGQAIEYDDQGNPTSYLGHTLTWEKGRQLKKFDSIEYTYNANGIRTSKTVNGVKHEYTLDGAKILREAWGSNTLVPLYDNEDSVCGILYNHVPYYFQKNLQGDVIAIVDKDAQTVARYVYDAWGVCTGTQDSVDIANVNPFRYRGYYYDEEIGLYYLQSRYYNPDVGRFVNGDDVIITCAFVEKASSLNHNSFAYCQNTPIVFFDPVGYYGSALVLSGSLVASMSGALYGIMASISASVASIKTAIAMSWFLPICLAATAIAIIGIVHVVNKVASLIESAAQTISAVVAKAKTGGIDPKNLNSYTVYIIVRKGTVDVVYVGITKNYASRKSQHTGSGKRFPKSKYTMLPIATGLSKTQARAMEQTIITAYTLDTLKNMINSITPSKWKKFKREFNQMRTLIESWKDPE